MFNKIHYEEFARYRQSQASADVKLSILGFNKTRAGEIWNVKCATMGSEIYNLNWRSEHNSTTIQEVRTKVYVKMVPS